MTARKPEMRPEDQRPRKRRPASTAQGREDQLVNLAIDLAEEQLRNGTASAQVISHYLQMGSPREKIARRKLELEANVLKAKEEQLQSQRRVEELYENAISAMRRYGGQDE